MSGIAAILSLDGKPVSQLDIQIMTARLAHRGGDGFDHWTQGPVGLGRTVLHTTRHSSGKRFISSLPGHRLSDLAISCDARIDNRNELLGWLGLPENGTEVISDGELILAAYEQWGEQCVEKFLGDFAFIIWDGRRQSLFCCRDHFGVKPFYYHRTPAAIYCASEIKALLCLEQAPGRLNEQMIAEHIIGAYQSREETLYRDIRRLPPGHSMTIGPEGARLEAYWSLDPSREIRLGSDDEYAEAFRERFTEAVRCRLSSDYPVGCTLSGGLDSSAIACIASQLLTRNGGGSLMSFTAIFDEVKECDERQFSDAVVARYRIKPSYVQGDQIGPLTDLDQMLWHGDKPVSGPNLFLHWGLLKAAKQAGVRIMLDGFDGDSVVSHGYQYLNELAGKGQWLRLLSEIVMVSKRFGESPWRPLAGYVRRYGVNPALSKSRALKAMRRTWRVLIRSARRESCAGMRHFGLGSLINQDFARSTGIEQQYKSWQKAQAGRASKERQGHYLTLTQNNLPLAFETYDTAAAAFSMEMRYPFWDKRLVEFCLALPPEQKMRRGWTRLVMRRAMEGILPAKVQWRGGKTDFIPVFHHGLTRFDRERLEDVLSNASKEVGQYINTGVLRETFERIRTDWSENRAHDLLSFWKAFSLALWLQFSWPLSRQAEEVMHM